LKKGISEFSPIQKQPSHRFSFAAYLNDEVKTQPTSSLPFLYLIFIEWVSTCCRFRKEALKVKFSKLGIEGKSEAPRNPFGKEEDDDESEDEEQEDLSGYLQKESEEETNNEDVPESETEEQEETENTDEEESN